MHRRNAIYTPTPLTALFAFATHNFNIAGSANTPTAKEQTRGERHENVA